MAALSSKIEGRCWHVTDLEGHGIDLALVVSLVAYAAYLQRTSLG